MVVITGILWRTTPTSLVPDEDQGYYIAAVYLPDGSSLERTDRVVARVVDAIRSNPANKDIIAFTGFDFLGGGYKNSAATMFIVQEHWEKRKVPVTALVGEIFAKTAGIQEALVLAFNPPAIFGLGNTGGFEMYIQNKGEGGPKKLAEALGTFLAAAQKDRQLGLVNTLWRAATPQLYVDVDREKAKALGVPLDDAFNTLAATLGSYYVNDFNKFGRAWQVLLSADAPYRKRPEDIGRMYVRSHSGAMVPVSAFAKVEFSSGPDSLDRYNNLPAVKLFGAGAPHVSPGQALAAVERVAKASLPAALPLDCPGSSFQDTRPPGPSGLALRMGAIMVFLILAALYEGGRSRLRPPRAALRHVRALLAVNLRGFSNDVYCQIGLVMLIGLAAKNAILIVEYALMKWQQGWHPAAAALEAARLRFRPIIMTSLAFILGVLPLAVSTGAGAGARRSVGTGVMGGMLAATGLAVFFIPLFFKFIVTRRLKTTPEDMEAPAETPKPEPASPAPAGA